MIEQIDFFRKTATELRSLAQKDPAIADALRRMADELDGKAVQLDGDEGHSRIGECQPLGLCRGRLRSQGWVGMQRKPMLRDENPHRDKDS